MDFLNAIVALLNFVIVPATAYGAQLALGALGVTLIYGILRFSNFAHGDTMAFGTMITILATWGLQSLGVTAGPLPTALIALPAALNAAVVMGLLPTKGLTLPFLSYGRSSLLVCFLAVGVLLAVARGVEGPAPAEEPS